MQLFPHQQRALQETEKFNRVAYYLDMGLGKTFVGSEKANSFPENIILICQKSKIQDWVEHFRQYYPMGVFDLTDKKQFEEFQGTVGRFVGVINYDLVFRRPYFAHISGFTLVLDESSIIQNETAKRSKFILKMKPKNVILLSGTPTAGKYEKLWSQLHLLGWEISKDLFYKQYVEIEWIEDHNSGFRIPQIVGYKNVDRLKRKLTEHGAIFRFILDGGVLIPDIVNQESSDSYHVMTMNENGEVQGFNWTRVPLIPLKYNEQETPLIKKVKSLQDGINIMLSDFENGMQEDTRNTILVLKNYDGTNLGEFRRNLATFGAVKVRYDGETKGGVETLEITVNSENYKAILEIFKKAIIENGMGYDAKDDRLSGNPNQMNIQSMYSDIDLDANDMETELQAAFEDVLWFVNAYLSNSGYGDFEGEDVNIIFNRDILINESEAIDNCAKSVGILSDETIIGMHPWVDDVQKEMDRLEEQKQKEKEEAEANAYNPFAPNPQQQGASQQKGGEVDEE